MGVEKARFYVRRHQEEDEQIREDNELQSIFLRQTQVTASSSC